MAMVTSKTDQLITMFTTVPVSLDISQKVRIARAIVDELPEEELDDLVEYIMQDVIVGHLSKRLKGEPKP